MLETCTAAVRGEMNRRRASSVLVSPSAISSATSRSRGVSGAPVGSPSSESSPTEDAILSRWTYEAEQSQAWTQRDRSAIYGGFHLYVKAGRA